MQFSDDGSTLLTWDHHDVRAYAMPSGRELWRKDLLRGIENVRVDGTGSVVVIGGGPGDSTMIVDGRTGTWKHTIPREQSRIYWVAMSKDGRYAATCEFGGKIHIVDTRSGKMVSTPTESDGQSLFTPEF